MSGSISIAGDVGTVGTITAASLASNYTPITVTAGSDGATYVGASVYSILSGAQFLYPTGSVKNGFLLDYVALTGANGAQTLLSEGEVDPSFGGKSSTDIIATSRNGMAIAPQLIVPGDLNGGIGGRDVAGVTNLLVGTAGTPAAISGTPAVVPLTVTGHVSNPATSYTAASLQKLGQSTQTDTFLSGTTPSTTAFTGVPLSTVVGTAGLPSGLAQDDYVVATGSDGYGVVYSEGEIDPAVRTSPTALIAYYDGKGTSPSLGGVPGALRTTSPMDAKGGRYVSNLANVAVATPNTDTVYRLYEAALGRAPDAGGGAFWSGLLDHGTTMSQVALGLLQSAESQTFYAGAGGNAGFVTGLYQSVLGRAPEAGGSNFWTGLLANGTSRADVTVGFTTTAEALLHNVVSTGSR